MAMNKENTAYESTQRIEAQEIEKMTPEKEKEMELIEKRNNVDQEVQYLEQQEPENKRSIFETMKQKYEDYKGAKRQEKIEKQAIRQEYDRQLNEIRKKQKLIDYERKLQEKVEVESLPAEERRKVKIEKVQEKARAFGEKLGSSMGSSTVLSGGFSGGVDRMLGRTSNPNQKGFERMLGNGNKGSNFGNIDRMLGTRKTPGRNDILNYTGRGPDMGGKVRQHTSGAKFNVNMGRPINTNISKYTKTSFGNNALRSELGGFKNRNVLEKGFGSNFLNSELKGGPKGFTSKELFSSSDRDKKLKRLLGK